MGFKLVRADSTLATQVGEKNAVAEDDTAATATADKTVVVSDSDCVLKMNQPPSYNLLYRYSKDCLEYSPDVKPYFNQFYSGPYYPNKNTLVRKTCD
jgi:predicted secreted Zn-dependent protease